MKNATYATTLAALIWSAGTALSQTPVHVNEAVARVQARIEPHMSVSEPVVVVVDLQDYLIELPINGQVHFSVRANMQQVELQVACTDLYEEGDPLSAHRIPVAGAGAEVTCEDGLSQLLSWQPGALSGALPAGWTGSVSESGIFASSGPTLHQDVTVDVSWWATDSDLPLGEYRGIVRPIGMVRP